MSTAKRKASDELPAEVEAAEVVEAPKAPVLSSGEFASTIRANRRVPFAGLLASDPRLRDQKLTREAWEQRLAKYLTSPLPSRR